VRANADTLGFTIPGGITLSRDYRIRVSSTTPGIAGLTSNFKVRISNGDYLQPLLRTFGDTLETDFNPLYTYTWYRNTNAVPGQTTNQYVAPDAATYSVRVEYNGCAATSAPLFFDPLSVKDALANGIKIYPNPVVDKLRIESVDAASVTVLDLSGKTILSLPKERNTDVNVSGLTPGVYYVRMSTAKATTIVKVVKL
jgi:hypothetical protein